MQADWRHLPRGILDRLRYRNQSGLLIRRHRALRRLDFRSASVFHPLLLLLLGYLLLIAGAAAISEFWAVTLRFWMPRLGLAGTVELQPTSLLGAIPFALPTPLIEARAPDDATLQSIAWTAGGAMVASFFGLRRDRLPLAYFVWAVAIIQLIACLFFVASPSPFPHALAKHVADGFGAVAALLLLAPLLLSFSYYAFDHGLLKKASGTAVILLGLILVVPYQYLAHVVLIQHFTLALMPPLYTVFGLLFDIAVFVSLYAWVVSWEP